MNFASAETECVYRSTSLRRYTSTYVIRFFFHHTRNCNYDEYIYMYTSIIYGYWVYLLIENSSYDEDMAHVPVA